MKWTTCILFNCITFVVSAQVPDSLTKIFMYTPAKISFQVDSSFEEGKIKVERLTYVSTDSFITSAYLTYPIVLKPGRPLIIFQHWGEGDKSEFLEEAKGFSKKGFVCLMPDGPWLCPNTTISSFKRQGYEMYRQNVMNDRTAIDLAIQQMDIDTSHIYFVGHSFGCNTGAILSAIDYRIDYFVFMAGLSAMTKNLQETQLPDFVEWRTTEPEQFREWIHKTRILDAELYLPYKTSPCLIQVAYHDEYISPDENDAFIHVTAEPKTVKKYDSNHALNEQARKDRRSWILKLVRRLEG
jgi:cephalosporin-C deacetylase-like acetyl esterase